MSSALHALVFSVWTSLLVPHTSDADKLADAAVAAVIEDASNAPVYRSHAEDLAVLAVYLEQESRVQLHPHAWSWDAKAGVSCGAFQTPCASVAKRSLLEQARFVLGLMRRGLVVCPAQPLAPALGGCHAGRRGADMRVKRARELLAAFLAGDVALCKLS